MRKTNKVCQQLVAHLLLGCFLLESCSTPNIQIQPKTDKTSAAYLEAQGVDASSLIQADTDVVSNNLSNNNQLPTIDNATGAVLSNNTESNQLAVTQEGAAVTTMVDTTKSITASNQQLSNLPQRNYPNTSINKKNSAKSYSNNSRLRDHHALAVRQKTAVAKRVTSQTPIHRQVHELFSLLKGQTYITKGGSHVSFEDKEGRELQAIVEDKYLIGFTRQLLPVVIEHGLNCTEKTVQSRAWQKQYIHIMKNCVYVGHMGLMGGGKYGLNKEKKDHQVIQTQIEFNSDYQYEDNDIQAILTSRISQLRRSSPAYVTKPINVLGAVDNIIPDQLQHRLQEENNAYSGGRVLLVPCNLGNYHWVGILIEIDDNRQIARAEYIDSLNGAIPESLQQQFASIYPNYTLQRRSLLKQNDATSCGAYTIENLLFALQNLTPAELSIAQIRCLHLECLQKYNPTFFNTFYVRQKENKPTTESIQVQLGLHETSSSYSKREIKQILSINKCLIGIKDEKVKAQLWAAFEAKEKCKDNHKLYLNGIRESLKQAALSLNSDKDKESLNNLVELLFGLKIDVINFPATIGIIDDSDFHLDYNPIVAITQINLGLQEQEINKIQKSLDNQIKKDEEFAKELQARLRYQALLDRTTEDAEAQFQQGKNAYDLYVLWEKEGQQKESYYYDQAINWLEKAANQGHEEAITLLKELHQPMLMEAEAAKKQEKRKLEEEESEERKTGQVDEELEISSPVVHNLQEQITAQKSHSWLILSLDAGGVRSLLEAYVLNYIEKTLATKIEDHFGDPQAPVPPVRLGECFDLIAGTSMGGIIGLLMRIIDPNTNRPQYGMETIVKLFTTKLNNLLQRTAPLPAAVRQLFVSKYNPETFEEVLAEYFGEATLADLNKPTLITGYDAEKLKLYLFKSQEAKNNINKNFLLKDVARATSAAPTYFPPANIMNMGKIKYCFKDGALAANDPVFHAYIYAKENSRYPNSRFHIISIGSGIAKIPMLKTKEKKSGVLKLLPGILNAVMESSRKAALNHMRNIISERNNIDTYTRLDFEIESKSAGQIDNIKPKNIKKLVSYAEKKVEEDEKGEDSTLKKILNRLVKYYAKREYYIFYSLVKESRKQLQNREGKVNLSHSYLQDLSMPFVCERAIWEISHALSLPGMSQPTYLDLCGNKLVSKHSTLRYLGKLNALTYLDISNTNLTIEGLQKLKEANLYLDILKAHNNPTLNSMQANAVAEAVENYKICYLDSSVMHKLASYYQYQQQEYKATIMSKMEADSQATGSAEYHLARMYEKGVGIDKDYTKAIEWYQKAAKQGYLKAQLKLKKISPNGGEQETQVQEKARSRLEKHFKSSSPSITEVWQAYVPTKGEDIKKLPCDQQEALEQVDKIVTHDIERYCRDAEDLSRFSHTMQKLSNAFSKVAKATKDFVWGPDINSLKQFQEEVKRAYGPEVLKLGQAEHLEKSCIKRVVEVDLSHKQKREEFHARQKDITTKLKDDEEFISKPDRYSKQVEMLNSLVRKWIEEEKLYRATIGRLTNPVQSALADFYDWKRSVFHRFIKLYLGNYFIMYEALALGTVVRKPELLEQTIKCTNAIGAILADAFLPLGGLTAHVIGFGFEKAAEVYANKRMRIKAAKIGSLYGYRGLEGMVKVTQEVADGLLFRLKDVILDLTPESLDKLAKFASLQMIDYTLSKWEKDEQQSITSVEFLLYGTQHKPSWFKEFKQRFPLETEDGRKLNPWKLLIQSEQKILNQGKFMRAARIFAKQVKKYGGIFIKYAGETAELVCTSGAIY